ncbi:major facilitator superfamily domain-containing protein 1 [Prevotella brunnea]|uniref:Lysosomal dipeptide transporter MFSD1 n=1 Tax=Prevotella brunnea TaxID=2508867 RepID=A0A5C8GJM0_9BACT|nr:MFS transporter [Prevotella brunnea]MDR0187116.1 major facilitator superfamily domain-containing protein 1 [Prevotella brunnea]TXJ62198.1 major facilitator superfamily domain-containing protein 1 [Prevotella brunnea]
MTEQIKTLRDSAAMRWTALLLLSFAMFCAYIFVDILSPIKDLMLEQRGWDSTAFGTMQGSETFLNVWIFFLIFAGIILDKMGVRFTAVLSGCVMLTGALIKYYAISETFIGSGIANWFTENLNYIPGFDEMGVSPFYAGMPASAKVAAIGFMIFGCGTEMAGIMVSRGIVKWFKGREMALAMGSEMAFARLGVATCMIFSPFFAKFGGHIDVSRSVAFGVVLICIALMMFVVYFFMDKKLDSQTGEAEEKDDPFKISDLGQILTSMGFWLVALLCVLYYSAIFPFQKYAVNMLQCNLTFKDIPADSFWASPSVTFTQYFIMLIVAGTAFGFNFMKKKSLKYTLMVISVISLIAYCYMGYMRQSAESIFAVFPLLAVGITPILGNYVDHKGKAASMLILGSILLIACHLTFAFVLPIFKSSQVGGVVVAYLTILVLGASFSLVPASLWPSVPKLVDAKIIGSAYALIFWIQNIGLWLFPMIIGKVLDATNVGIKDPTKYDYTYPLLMLAGLGVVALFIGLILKIVDKKKHLGLEEPNIAA